MSIYGKLKNNALTDIANRPMAVYADGGVDVELAAQPSVFGPFTYDPVNKLAVVVLTDGDKLDRMGGRVLAALAIKNSPTTFAKLTAQQKQSLQDFIDAAAVGFVAAVGW